MSRILCSPRASHFLARFRAVSGYTRASNTKIKFTESYLRCACIMNLNKCSVRNLERKKAWEGYKMHATPPYD